MIFFNMLFLSCAVFAYESDRSCDSGPERFNSAYLTDLYISPPTFRCDNGVSKTVQHADWPPVKITNETMFTVSVTPDTSDKFRSFSSAYAVKVGEFEINIKLDPADREVFTRFGNSTELTFTSSPDNPNIITISEKDTSGQTNTCVVDLLSYGQNQIRIAFSTTTAPNFIR